MSERLFKFFLSEVKRVRLVCQSQRCQAVADVPLDLLRQGSATLECRFCGNKFFPKYEGETSPLAQLGEVMRYLQDRSESVKVEFSLPEGAAL